MENTLKLIETEKAYRDALLKMMEDHRSDMSLEKWASYYTAAFLAEKRIKTLEAICAKHIVEREINELNKKIAA